VKAATTEIINCLLKQDLGRYPRLMTYKPFM
jgi:hypothetical protein